MTLKRLESVVFTSSTFIYEGSLSTSGLFCVAGTALGAPSWGSAEVGQRLITLGAASVCVAGATFGAHSACFAWQAQHLEPLWLVLHGRRSTWSTFTEVCGSWATIDYIGRRFGLRGRRNIWGSFGLFCLARGALGAPLARFVWQAQHLEPLRSFCVAGAALGAIQARAKCGPICFGIGALCQHHHSQHHPPPHHHLPFPPHHHRRFAWQA